MTHQELTIENLFLTLQKEFGPFRDDAPQSGGIFEDVPAAVLDGEFAGEARIELPQIALEATAPSAATLAA